MTILEIPVTDLAVGDTIIEGKVRIPVKTIEPCTQPGGIHVNRSLCYSRIGSVEIIRKDKHDD